MKSLQPYLLLLLMALPCSVTAQLPHLIRWDSTPLEEYLQFVAGEGELWAIGTKTTYEKTWLRFSETGAVAEQFALQGKTYERHAQFVENNLYLGYGINDSALGGSRVGYMRKSRTGAHLVTGLSDSLFRHAFFDGMAVVEDKSVFVAALTFTLQPFARLNRYFLFDSLGNEIWSQTMNYSPITITYDVMEGRQRYYYATGMQSSANQGLFLYHTSFGNDSIWSAFAGRPGAVGQALFYTRDSAILVIGSNRADSSSRLETPFLAKFSEEGNLLWEQNVFLEFQGERHRDFRIQKDVPTQDGGLLIVGNAEFQLDSGRRWMPFFIKLDPQGVLAWSQVLELPWEEEVFFSTAGQLEDGRLLVFGTSGSSAWNNLLGFWAIFSNEGLITNLFSEEAELNALQVFPNPWLDEISLQWHQPVAGEARFTLTNLRGQPVATVVEAGAAGTRTITWKPTVLAEGMYLLIAEIPGKERIALQVIRRR